MATSWGGQGSFGGEAVSGTQIIKEVWLLCSNSQATDQGLQDAGFLENCNFYAAEQNIIYIVTASITIVCTVMALGSKLWIKAQMC